MRQKAHILTVILALCLRCSLVPAQLGVVTDSGAAMANIHKHLLNSSERTHNQALLFVGVIETLGSVYKGPCKQAVDERVGFRIENIISGEHEGLRVNTGYINCTGQPLPAPPFTLNDRVVVYCEQMQSHSFKCLSPVTFTAQRLATIQSWNAVLMKR